MTYSVSMPAIPSFCSPRRYSIKVLWWFLLFRLFLFFSLFSFHINTVSGTVSESVVNRHCIGNRRKRNENSIVIVDNIADNFLINNTERISCQLVTANRKSLSFKPILISLKN